MPANNSRDSLPRATTLVIATAGHVDHGKTSLVGHLTGVDTDTLAEEKARGLTINLGYAYLHFKNPEDAATDYTLGFVDVPGHTDFINNMLAGVGAVDAAILVVAADDGIMPQTREHLAILDLLGISNGLVAITKTDRVDQDRLDQVNADINELLEPTNLSGAPLFPVSNISGDGISDLGDHLKSLLTDTEHAINDTGKHYFRYLIDRCFSVKGIGTVVTGSVKAGSSTVDDTLLHTGSGDPVRVKAYRLDSSNMETIYQGQRAAANINLDLDKVARGDWLIDAAIYQPIHRFDATLNFIDPSFKPRSSAHYHLHMGASHRIVTLRHLGDSGESFHQLNSNESLIAHHGDRFILRDPASRYTLGGGTVVDIFVPRRKRSSEERLRNLQCLSQNSQLALQSLLDIDPTGINLDQFSLCRNLTTKSIDELLAELAESGLKFLLIGSDARSMGILIHRKHFDSATKRIQSEIQSFHKTNSNKQGISEPALSKQLKYSGAHTLLHAILDQLINDKLIKKNGTLLHLPEHRTALSAEEETFLAKVRPLLIKAGNIPPRTRELVEMTGIDLKLLEKILKDTAKAGSLIRVADNRHYLPETILQLADFTEKIASTTDSDAGFSVIDFRDASGIGRNLCIELLEYFDHIGFTRRDGNSRFIRTEKENIFGD